MSHETNAAFCRELVDVVERGLGWYQLDPIIVAGLLEAVSVNLLERSIQSTEG